MHLQAAQQQPAQRLHPCQPEQPDAADVSVRAPGLGALAVLTEAALASAGSSTTAASAARFPCPTSPTTARSRTAPPRRVHAQLCPASCWTDLLRHVIPGSGPLASPPCAPRERWSPRDTKWTSASTRWGNSSAKPSMFFLVGVSESQCHVVSPGGKLWDPLCARRSRGRSVPQPLRSLVARGRGVSGRDSPTVESLF